MATTSKPSTQSISRPSTLSTSKPSTQSTWEPPTPPYMNPSDPNHPYQQVYRNNNRRSNEETAPEKTAPEKTDTEETAPEKTAPEKTDTEETAPEKTAPEKTPEQVIDEICKLLLAQPGANLSRQLEQKCNKYIDVSLPQTVEPQQPASRIIEQPKIMQEPARYIVIEQQPVQHKLSVEQRVHSTNFMHRDNGELTGLGALVVVSIIVVFLGLLAYGTRMR